MNQTITTTFTRAELEAIRLSVGVEIQNLTAFALGNPDDSEHLFDLESVLRKVESLLDDSLLEDL